MAEKLGLDSVLARKDLAMAGVPGKPRRGYPARELQAAITAALGWDNSTDAVLVGVGSLGNALLGYRGFEEQSLSIAAAFDASPEIVGKTIHGVKVRPMGDLSRLVKRLNIRLGILTVPNAAGQPCADKLVAAGIRGIWNFTSVRLSVPDGVIVQRHRPERRPRTVAGRPLARDLGQAPFAGLQPNGRRFTTTVMNFYSFDLGGKICKDVAAIGIAGILQGV